MRHFDLTAWIGVAWLALAGAAAAFEIEEDTTFAGTGSAQISVLSTTDTQAFAPVIIAFQKDRPDVTVRYVVANSQDVFSAVQDQAAFDLVISSAMDLQLKLANDGFAQGYSSAATTGLPSWAKWRDQLFAFAQEPVVMVLSRAGFDGLPLPRTRADLIRTLRDHPDRFAGRVGTYDPQQSGAGYLFATQDARQSDTSWRLAEVMGGLDPQLFTASGDMIAGVQGGRLDVALNVLGSYAAARLPVGGDGVIVAPQDFTHVLLRTALIPRDAAAPALGQAFLDFLLSEEGQRLIEDETGLPRINEAALAAGPHLRPIRLDPGLLVFVDPLMRQRFLEEWTAAVVQP
ncbi:ABC transporter substrate-binding protein [Yoonia sp. 208BN28-4]|uniref:ABC transporter substrate-binding protein n=1 Tax=Yoonia sp. 208BN28-4 TaxID=3126505 RepID=UPI0030ABC761